jgi:predicted secreted protein
VSADLPQSLAATLAALAGMAQPAPRLAEIAADLPLLLTRTREAVDRIAAFEDEPAAFRAAQAALKP